jgi:hypothetical protein
MSAEFYVLETKEKILTHHHPEKDDSEKLKARPSATKNYFE